MASGGYSKCSCCQWRYATSNATYNGGRRIVAQYCEECKGGHNTSVRYPGKPLIYHDKQSYIPSNPSPKQGQYTYNVYSQRYERVQYIKCWCCEYKYKQSAVVKLEYQCGKHSYNVCIRCAKQHQTCPVDYATISIESERNFVHKLEGSGDKDPYQ